MEAPVHPNLILICGRPLTLKSTLAFDLSSSLQYGLVATGFFGSADYSSGASAFLESRQRRYVATARMVERYLDEGWSVITEGTFSRTTWRRPIFQAATVYQVNLCVIHCRCEDSAELIRRQDIRTASTFAMDRQARPYDRARVVDMGEEPLNIDEWREVPSAVLVEIDTHCWSVSCLGSTTPFAHSLEIVLKDWAALMRKRLQ